MNIKLKLLILCIVITLGFLIYSNLWQSGQSRTERYVRNVLEQELVIQQQRRARIREGCSKLSPGTGFVSSSSPATPSSEVLAALNSSLKYMDHLIVDDVHKMIYCFVPKVASTNWKRVLMALNLNKNIADNPLQILGNETHALNLFSTLDKHTNVTQVYDKLRTYLTFMFVRDPFERLLSAYRNKFQITWSDYFRLRYGRLIIQSLRANATDQSRSKGDDVSFTEFLTYVTKLSRDRNLVDFNEHWRPIYNLCFPCLVDYDVIGKSETLVTDADHVLWTAGLLDSVQFPRREQTYNSVPTSVLMKRYYEDIEATLLDQISMLYKRDIQLFAY
ncbi:Carbohydrate sulfotransferase 11 [Halotydeus destructor]|nr:Carbohydrate sulfotransferase 11 [Halotydeus destructor]